MESASNQNHETDDNDSDSNEDSRVTTILKKRSPIHNFFTFDSKLGKSICKSKSCEMRINGQNTTNLVNHLKVKKHVKVEYVEYLAMKFAQEQHKSANRLNKKKIGDNNGMKSNIKVVQPTLLEVRIIL